MFKEGDIITSSINNAEAVFEKPIPQYKIYQIGMGRILAKNTRTGENVDLGSIESVEYYYVLNHRKMNLETVEKNCQYCVFGQCMMQAGDMESVTLEEFIRERYCKYYFSCPCSQWYKSENEENDNARDSN